MSNAQFYISLAVPTLVIILGFIQSNAKVTARFNAIDQRFYAMDKGMTARFDGVDKRLDSIDTRLLSMSTALLHLAEKWANTRAS